MNGDKTAKERQVRKREKQFGLTEGVKQSLGSTYQSVEHALAKSKAPQWIQIMSIAAAMLLKTKDRIQLLVFASYLKAIRSHTQAGEGDRMTKEALHILVMYIEECPLSGDTFTILDYLGDVIEQELSTTQDDGAADIDGHRSEADAPPRRSKTDHGVTRFDETVLSFRTAKLVQEVQDAWSQSGLAISDGRRAADIIGRARLWIANRILMEALLLTYNCAEASFYEQRNDKKFLSPRKIMKTVHRVISNRSDASKARGGGTIGAAQPGARDAMCAVADEALLELGQTIGCGADRFIP
ncbi:hypothetical protein J8273_3853 [Carpediemonas membranifera]|uniref:Uncharacterized protein n=1 Tax=Carpediemonas membranifera TaxID=201153 RepID=A0A8J6E056_9EUKA|nr:hypothetical protein J8273_3853 [Carpediemonas membranifera]|eukprot:KAG9394599.1 hypothetical protein J8273_3853 [Carpediemonas membranifera]